MDHAEKPPIAQIGGQKQGIIGGSYFWAHKVDLVVVRSSGVLPSTDLLNFMIAAMDAAQPTP